MLLLKKILRDLWMNKSRSLPVIILITTSQVASSLYIQYGGVMEVSTTKYYEHVNMGDIWLDTLSITPSIFNNSVVAQWNQSGAIQFIEPRLFFKGYIALQDEKIPVDIITLPSDRRATVNDIITADSSYFDDFPLNKNAVYIEQSYLKYHKLESLKDLYLNVNYGSGTKDLNLTILGGAYSPEYPLRPGGVSAQFDFSASFSPYLTMSVFLRTDYLQEEIFQGQEVYNQICISLKDNYEVDTFFNSLQQENSPLFHQSINIRKDPKLIEDMIIILYGVGWGIAFFFLIISMFLTFTIINRFLNEQRPHIGVMKSLGYSNQYLISRNLFFGIILGLIGSILGNIIGYFLGFFVADFAVNAMLSFPKTVMALDIVQILLMVIITVICSVFASYISVRNIARVPPSEAVRPVIEERKVSTFILERFIQRIFRVRLPVEVKYSLRNTIINPKRTITTIISLLMAVALVGGVFTIVISVVNGNSAMFESEQWDIQVNFSDGQNFTDIHSDIINTVLNPELLKIEPLLIDSAKLSNKKNVWNRIAFTAIKNNTKLKILEGAENGFLNNTSAIISSDIATMLEVEVKKSYIMVGKNGTQAKVYIQHILPSYYVNEFFIPIKLGNYLSYGNEMSGLTNGVLLAKRDFSENEVNKLNDLIYVKNLVLKTDIIRQTSTWYNTMGSVIFGVLILVLIISGLISFSMFSISVIERKNDLIIMKSVGIQNRDIYKWSFIETVFYSLIASFGYFIGFYISIWYMDILQSLMQQPQGTTNLSLVHYFVSLIFGFIAAAMGQFFSLHYVLKERIATVTKEKMFG